MSTWEAFVKVRIPVTHSLPRSCVTLIERYQIDLMPFVSNNPPWWLSCISLTSRYLQIAVIIDFSVCLFVFSLGIEITLVSNSQAPSFLLLKTKILFVFFQIYKTSATVHKTSEEAFHFSEIISCCFLMNFGYFQNW